MNHLSKLNINFPSVKFALKHKNAMTVAQSLAYNTNHSDYQLASGIISMMEIEKNVVFDIKEHLKHMKNYLNENTERFMSENNERLSELLQHSRDNNYTYNIHAVETFKKSYAVKMNNIPLETPQHMFMRNACGIWFNDLSMCSKLFDALSNKKVVLASPQLSNAGLVNNTLASCFLMQMEDDTISIMDNLKWAAISSKGAGGIGIGLGRIRHSKIGNKGVSSGVVPVIKMIESTIKMFNQTGMREGACKVTLPSWHTDILDFIEMKRNVGKEELRARFLHYSVWIQNLFMVRAIRNEKWSLFCPKMAQGFGPEFEELVEHYNKHSLNNPEEFERLLNQCNTKHQEIGFGPEFEMLYKAFNEKKNVDEAMKLAIKAHKLTLNDCFGEEFEQLYTRCEKDTRIPRTTISAREVLEKICSIQTEVGEPFVMFDDLVNYKSSHKHLGHITNSNLCQEITLYSKPDETIAVCNLASLIIDNFWDEKNQTMKWDEIGEYTRLLVQTLNRVIDVNCYQTEQTRNGNMTQRPIAIGILGLADLFVKANIPYDSQEAKVLIEKISACMYYHGVMESVNLTSKYGVPSAWYNSTWSNGELQPDLWNNEFDQYKRYGNDIVEGLKKSGRIQSELVNPQEFGVNDTWDNVRSCVKKGIANSHIFCQMPNASTAHICGRNEAIEPFYRLIFRKNGLSGEYLILNHHLVKKLEERNIWQDENTRKKIIQYMIDKDGSIQGLSSVLNLDIKDIEYLFRTSFEIPQRKICELYASRAKYICNSQSLNIYMAHPTKEKLVALHMFNWYIGNKTSCYYLRSQSDATSQKILLKEEDCISCQ